MKLDTVMEFMLYIVFSIINALITMAFLPFLLDVYQKTDRSFYLFWGIGFFLSGLRIVLQTIARTYVLIDFPLSAISLLVLFGSLMFIIMGLGDLIGELVNTSLILGGLPIFLSILYVKFSTEQVFLIFNLGLYAFILWILPYLSTKYSISLRYILIGLVSIFFVVVLENGGLLPNYFTELIHIGGKSLIFLGFTQPRFKFLAYDISGYLSAVDESSSDENNYTTKLILLNSEMQESKLKELDFFVNRLKRNLCTGVKTILVVTYDLIQINDLQKYMVEPDDLHIIRILSSGRGSGFRFSFDEHESIISEDLGDLDIILSEIIENVELNKIHCEVFIYDLSTLSHLQGNKRVYSFIVSKISKLKNSNVCLFAYIHPKTHNDRTEVALFESIADRIEYI